MCSQNSFLLIFLHCIQCLGLLPLAITLTQDFPTKVLPQSKILLLCLQPVVWKPQPCCITLCLSPTQGSLILTRKPSHKMGYFANNKDVYSSTLTPAPPTSSQNNNLTPLHKFPLFNYNAGPRSANHKQ